VLEVQNHHDGIAVFLPLPIQSDQASFLGHIWAFL